MSAYSDLILAKASLSGYWRMGESSGTTLTDAGPNANNGTLASSGVTYSVTGPLANDADTALTFDASSNPADIPDHASLDMGNGAFWIAFWFKRSATQGAIQTILYKGSGAYQVSFNAANRLALSLAPNGTILVRTEAITDQDWHFAVLQRSGTTRQVFIDAVNVSVTVGNPTLADTANVLQMGHQTSVQRFPGSLDELAIGKGAILTADEVLQLYRTAIGQIVLTDSVGSSDATGAGPESVQADSVTASEARQLDVEKAQADAVTASEDRALDVETTLQDQATVSDALVAAGEVALGDSVTVSDDVAADLIEDLLKSLDDSVAVTDDLVTTLTPLAEGRSSGVVWHPPPTQRYRLELADFVWTRDGSDFVLERDRKLQRRKELVLALVSS